MLFESIVREHSYKPIRGAALLTGRQTVYLSREQYIEMVRRHGINPSEEQLGRTTIDHQTIERQPSPYATETITDHSILLLNSTCDYFDVRPDYLFLRHDYVARYPSSERRRHQQETALKKTRSREESFAGLCACFPWGHAN